MSPLLPLSLGTLSSCNLADYIALLSWIDLKHEKPTWDDLDSFTQAVNLKLSELCLPSAVCTSAHVRDFVAHLAFPDLSGVAAVVGGILSQDVLNVLGRKEMPLKNWLVFDGSACMQTHAARS